MSVIRTATVDDFSGRAIVTEALLRVVAAAETYGTTQPFCRFYVGEDSVFSVMDGVAAVHFGRDVEDVMLYLTMSPDVRRVRTDADHAEELAARWGTEASVGTVMQAKGKIALCGHAEISAPSGLYPLLETAFKNDLPPFNAWYADAHYRYRHGRFHAVTVRCGERAVSCAMTTAECVGAALLGGVVTLPEYRGRGYASACVTTLANQCRVAGQEVWISPKNAGAEKMYRELGFTACGRWGIVEKP